MRKTEFIETIKDMATQFGEVEIQKIEKADGAYTGLAIKVPSGVPTPVVNLDLMYEQYLINDLPIEEVFKQVKKILTMRPDMELKPKDITNWDKARTKLYLRPFGHISGGINQQVEDIYLVPYLELAGNGSAMVRVTPQLINAWGVDEETVFRVARENQEEIRPATITSMSELIGLPAPFPMYVVSTENQAFGASAIFYDGIEEKIRDRMGGDFYILPSSVHEVIVIPRNIEGSIEELEEMVTMINGTAVDECDRLTNSVYVFEDNELTKVS